MDALKVKKKALRASFTNTEKSLAQLLAILETDAKDIDKLYVLDSQLEDKFSRLNEIQNEISSLLLEENTAEYETDFETAEKYRDRYLEMKSKVATFLNKNSRCASECSSKDLRN
ncbi:integrase catalytic domain-containing protein [Trichonephila inaurata madagascariensis]|uniref:Integrase catalytic domain-containing protein n=1 Tax=Trichonephila inaurata madagascariensis TaxID=2747483 RepID=A0A8X6YU15_9ARAC|nr:integrase catalytic domain-containing protein [Trichonephila inaurata madagascariensis]